MALVTLSVTLAPAIALGVTLTDPAVPPIVMVPMSAPIAVQVLPFYKGDKGEPGDDGGAMTAGSGIIIVGSEIRLSIGTLPQVG